MSVELKVKGIILNRGWIYNSNEECIGEINFVVDCEYLKDAYERFFIDKYSSLVDFLAYYIPDIDGKAVYTDAIICEKLVEDMDAVLYSNLED